MIPIINSSVPDAVIAAVASEKKGFFFSIVFVDRWRRRMISNSLLARVFDCDSFVFFCFFWFLVHFVDLVRVARAPSRIVTGNEQNGQNQH